VCIRACASGRGRAPGRRGRKVALSRMRRTSPVPSRAACSAAARLRAHGARLFRCPRTQALAA